MLPLKLIDLAGKDEYIQLLTAISNLSGLFSESTIPFIHYRVAENAFCRSFGAKNLSRSDTAFDAQIDDCGIGLKTFTCPQDKSLEKVAEFNALSPQLAGLEGIDLAKALAKYRNDRIGLAYNLYGIKRGIYHIVARREKELLLFETDYDFIDTTNLRLEKSSKGFFFGDGKNEYSFNRSKSTLFRRFKLPSEDAIIKVPVEILKDPYEALLRLAALKEDKVEASRSQAGKDYVVLPLYGTKQKEAKHVEEKSGLNQWNAGGRKRDAGELYIPIPSLVRKYCADFFPSRDESFELHIPTGEVFSAKVCQDGGKALMTNPNKAMSDWLLRKLFQLPERQLLTTEHLKKYNVDSLMVYKEDGQYRIDVAPYDSYEQFVKEIEG